MLFSSITFLYAFLPLTLLFYFLAPARAKNAVLLLASLLFYGFGEPRCVLLLLFSALSGYVHALLIEKYRGTRGARAALWSGLLLNLALLCFFKYADFTVATVNTLLGTNLPLPGIPLPLGVSFFTFQAMSYLVDVYRSQAHAARNLVSFSTFLCLFPQLVAGPIVRYTEVADALAARRIGWEDLGCGARRFVCGLGKKVLLANALGGLCATFRTAEDKSVLFYWLYAVAFTLQIYFDFSGYSDMAIGLGRIFGFRFPENFNYPYISRSVTEFWRRWHMTLSGWFRDYVYLPLGGSRASKWAMLRNLTVVWLLTGLWHGAAWNFVLWGGWYAALLILEKLWLGKHLARLGPVLPRVFVLLVTVLGFVLFNADGLSGAWNDFSALFGGGGLPIWNETTRYYLASYAGLLLVAAVAATPAAKLVYGRVQNSRPMVAVEPLCTAVILLLSTAALVDGSFNPFLYFRF